MQKNYYKILGISKGATEKEIKRAYGALLRKYPPEKFPDEFSDIAKAYEVLMNSEKRKIYDDTNGFDEVAQSFMDIAMENYFNDNYEEAIKSYKKFILLEPTANSARNYLSICYAKIGEYEKAYNVLKEVFDNGYEIKEVYYTNICNYCMNLEKYYDAELYLSKGLKEYDTYNINIEFVRLYVKSEYENKEKAKEILINKINPMLENEELSVFDYLDLAYYAVVLKCGEYFDKYLLEIEELCNEFGQLENLISDLYFYIKLSVSCWRFEEGSKYAKTVINILKKISVKEEDYKQIKEYYSNLYKILNELKYFGKEEHGYSEVIEYIVSGLKLTLLKDDDDDINELDKQLSVASEKLSEAVSNYPYAIKDSIQVLINNYPTIYSEYKNEFDGLYSLAVKKCNEISDRNNVVKEREYSNVKDNGGGGIVIICMIIGGIIGGPIGIVIGMIIGNALSKGE